MALHTGFADDQSSPGLLLWRVTNQWQSQIRAALKPLGLTHVQFVLLASLAYLGDHHDGPLTQRELAEFAAMDPMMTSQVVRVLADNGWVQRDDHPSDRRAKTVRATAMGEALANRAIPVVEACDRAFFADAGPSFTAGLHALATRSAR
jgi:DNA-binding MarR family transcriptional regulator